MADPHNALAALTKLTAKTNTSHHDDEIPLPTPLKTLTLSIGGRPFKVSRTTLLSESNLFRLQMSDKYASAWKPEEDGTYFMDADPDIFEHLLRFMRRPSVFPLFYHRVKGFDYDLYNRLQAEAEYFQVDALEEWIREKKYLQAITTHTSAPLTRDIAQMGTTTCTANNNEDWYVVPRTRKVYLCPRQIPVHRGRQDMCGLACAKKQEGNPIEYEEETWMEVVIVKREVVFDEKVCRSDFE